MVGATWIAGSPAPAPPITARNHCGHGSGAHSEGAGREAAADDPHRAVDGEEEGIFARRILHHSLWVGEDLHGAGPDATAGVHARSLGRWK